MSRQGVPEHPERLQAHSATPGGDGRLLGDLEDAGASGRVAGGQGHVRQDAAAHSHQRQQRGVPQGVTGAHPRAAT